MKLSRLCTKKHYTLPLFVLFLLIVYNEFFSYIRASSKWLELKCENPKQCTKILLVADPQIIGQYREIIHFLTPLSIFDSDMYLKKTFREAFKFSKPDVVIFLGDLMDEGSTATNEEFYSYVRRVFHIFLDPDRYVQNIWLPGDNDIGGEGFDLVTAQKLKRFNHSFHQPDLIEYRHITFFKINRFIQQIPVFKEKREFYDTRKIFIGLSHMPLMFMPSLFVEKALAKMAPQLLFTAHEHKSMVISTNALLQGDRQIIPITSDNSQVLEFSLGATDMYEFIVPTCSYRMGTEQIGFGYAVLENNELRYTVLWSPSRFRQLASYLVVIVGIIFFYLCCKLRYKSGYMRRV